MGDGVNPVTLGTWTPNSWTRKLITKVLNSGRLSYGPMCREFEQRFAELHGCEYGVLANSGTSALVVALQALKELYGWQDGDEVIVPALTFVATINAVLHCNLKPVLADIDEDTYLVSQDRIVEAVSYRTRAIIPVHLFGQRWDHGGLWWPGQEYYVETTYRPHVIEDSCEAVGGPPILGSIACYSFYAAHHIVAGIGGMAITNFPELAHHMRSLVNHGLDVSQLPTGQEYDPSFLGRHFQFDRIGHSFRITELEAALALPQLDYLEEMVARRRENARYLIDHLAHWEEIGILRLPYNEPGLYHSWMMFPMVLARHNPNPSQEIMVYLQERGIECRQAMPLVTQPCYQGMWDPDDYPVARWVGEKGFYVGCHQDLTKGDLDRIVTAIDDYFRQQ